MKKINSPKSIYQNCIFADYLNLLKWKKLEGQKFASF